MTSRIACAATAALAVALLAGCGTSAPAATTTAAPAATTSAAAPASTTAAAPTTSAVQTITVTYAGGKVSGDIGRVKVTAGRMVEIVVTSDVADEVHLHGYDKMVDVPKGGTATLRFTATIKGVFEVELEKLGKQLLQVEVS